LFEPFRLSTLKRELQPGAGSVDIWSRDCLAAVTTRIRIAEIIRHDEDDVRAAKAEG
jgi:hypothetical protein